VWSWRVANHSFCHEDVENEDEDDVAAADDDGGVEGDDDEDEHSNSVAHPK